MPVRDGERFVTEAIQSILKQTFQDFEFIIVDDGSSDGTRNILERFHQKDRRIIIYHQEKLGFTEALNRACALAQGKYIARMDSDDISLPERLRRQVELLDADPGCKVCGSWIRTVGYAKGQVVRYPTTSERVRSQLLFDCCLAHPSVMMRRDLFADCGLNYDGDFREASDYRLWVEVTKFGTLMNIPEVLLLYRKHPLQVSEQDRQQQQRLAQQVRLLQLERLSVSLEPGEFELHTALSTDLSPTTQEFVERTERWLLKLQAANEKSGCYDLLAFAEVLSDCWLHICSAATAHGPWAFRRFFTSSLSKHAQLTFADKSKFLTRCLVRRSRSEAVLESPSYSLR